MFHSQVVVFRIVCSSRSGKRWLPISPLFCRPRESLTIRIDSIISLTAVIPCQSYHTQLQQQIKRDHFIIQGTIPSICKESEMGLRVGQYAELHRKYTQADVNAFCEVSGDYNPVHSSRPVCDNSNVDTNTHDHHTVHQQLKSSKSIVHGVLLTSIFSTIFGTLIPGCMYRSQSFKFYNPVYVDEEVFGHVVVTRLRQINTRDSNNDDNNNSNNGSGVLCKCDTTIYKKIHPCRSINSNEEIVDILCIDGEAQVWIPNSTLKDD